MNEKPPKYVVFAVSARNVERIPVIPVDDETDEQAQHRIAADYRDAGWTVRVLNVVEPPPKPKYRIGVSLIPGEPPISAWRAQARIDGDIRCTAFSPDADTARRAVRAAMAVLHPEAEEETT